MNVRIALCQLKVSEKKEENIKSMREYAEKAASLGAKIFALPEMWTCPYTPQLCFDAAEEEGGETYQALSQAAKDNGLYVIGGSYPIKVEGEDLVYNRCYVFAPDGSCIGQYDKAHLFDADVTDGLNLKESGYTKAGDSPALVVDTDLGRIGVAICYDVRFPQHFIKMAEKGVSLVFLPSAFTVKTGEAQWELLMRARAADGMFFMAGISSSKDDTSRYVVYGHSCVTDPLGNVINMIGDDPDLLIQDIDTDAPLAVRVAIPTLRHRRPELY